MKLFNRNPGTGSLLVRVGKTLVTLRPGMNNVSDDIGEAILAQNLRGISAADEGAIKEKAQAVKESSDLKAENKALKDQVAKLQLIAAQVPVDLSGELATARAELEAARIEIADLKAKLEAKPKRGRPPKDKDAETEAEPATAAEAAATTE